MLQFFSILAAFRVFFRSRSDVALEILALRQQVAVLKRRRPRPALNSLDRLFWTTLRRVWPRWSDALIIVKSETVISWHRAGFRLYWRWRSRPRGGRPKITDEVTPLELPAEIIFLAPGFDEFDFSLVKNYHFKERRFIEFRAEVFNLFNRVNFFNPINLSLIPPAAGSGNLNVTSQGSFGVITAAQPSRQIQLGMRFVF